jgi:sulfoxide reductase heme-binding subunit YedZ
MSRLLVWLLFAAPLVFQAYRYLSEVIFYGEFVHWTGDQSARLLIVTLAITPLRLTFPTAGWTRWLLLHRRDFGLASALYALAHTIVYLAYRADFSRIAAEAMEVGLLTGWLAFLIFVPLAMTSNNAAVRHLGGRWKRLHRAIYVAAALTFAHWVLTAFDPTAGYIHLAVLVAFMVLRIWQVSRRRRVHSA